MEQGVASALSPASASTPVAALSRSMDAPIWRRSRDPTLQQRCRQPLEVAEMLDKFDIVAKIEGGGITGWADALAHGAARALVAYDEKFRPEMRKAGLLTRDPRVKERKKPGLKRARKAPQYTKR